MGEALDAVNRFYDAFAANDLDAADAVFADDCRFVMPTGQLTKSEHRAMGGAFMAAAPDAHMVIDHAVDGGDEVVVEGRFVGTHTGDMVSPLSSMTGNSTKITAI